MKRMKTADMSAVLIPLTDAEMGVMDPYLKQMASAARSYQSAQLALSAIAKTISGRAGAPPEQKYKLDVAGKRLVPITQPDHPNSL